MASVPPRTVELTVTLPDCTVPLGDFRRMRMVRLLGPGVEVRTAIGALMASEEPSAPKRRGKR